MTNRPENWPDLLEAHLKYWAAQPFAWGKADCVHFVASWLTQLRYKAPLQGMPSWDSPLSAARVFVALGGFESAVADRLSALGAMEIKPLFASRGDVALTWIDDRRQALGIACGSRIAIRIEGKGVDQIPLSANVIRAWRV